jgi:hypothetical protein
MVIWGNGFMGAYGSPCTTDAKSNRRAANRSIRSAFNGMAIALASLWLFTSTQSGLSAEAPLPERIEFNRDVRPILADKCFACHGPDSAKREAGLRLDTFEGAAAKRDSGAAIVPRQVEASQLWQRVIHTDNDLRMPPDSTGKSLEPRQLAVLKRWIEQGAEYQSHWAFIPPRRVDPPTTIASGKTSNAIDRFVLARLAAEQLEAAPEADRRTLARRLSFDLLGLPPSPEDVAAFEADRSPRAHEDFVDRLFASPHYAERMAVYWLDVVRYADTAGYHSDNHRDLAPYRDYVVQAFHKNKPFDQFAVEQLAGDLLPQPTNESRIASGFNRLLQTTEEGGSQAREYTAKYAADRVRNSGVIWLGVTLGCSECHNHKFDPFSIKDFYSMQAFFADVAERAVGRQDQTPIPTPEQEQRLAELDDKLKSLRSTLTADSPELAADQMEWETRVAAELKAMKSTWTPLKPAAVASSGGQKFETLDDLSVLGSGDNPDLDTYTVELVPGESRVTGVRLEVLTHPSLANNGLSRANGNFVLSEIEFDWVAGPDSKPERLEVKRAEADFSQANFPIAAAIDRNATTGWAVDGHQKPADHKAVFALTKPRDPSPGAKLVVRMRHESQFPKHNVGRFRFSLSGVDEPTLSDAALPVAVVDAIKVPAADRTPAQRDALKQHFRGTAPRLDPIRRELAEAEKLREGLVKSFPQTLVTTAVAPRMIRILPRGNWLDESGEIVEPAVPASLNPLGVEGRRATRLDLARWLVAAENPLTARVFVNRLWKLTFGQGLVRTVEDLGTQGELPSHPELLDWLAVDFRESGWDIKRIHKQMVMSATYRQSSQGAAATAARAREIDPNNRLLSRQNRFRLDAEFVRDNALAISGLLSRRVGGPSVKPYQPAGYWANLNFPRREWQNDQGEDLYRRGLYTYWCRTFLHPSLAAFDAPSREECVAERPRSNTPLQALVLLNDPTYVEAARALAARALTPATVGANADDATRFVYLFQRATQRAPRPDETKLLSELLSRHREHFQGNAAAAQELLKVGAAPSPPDVPPAELAAWTSVARAVMNLHETVTRN